MTPPRELVSELCSVARRLDVEVRTAHFRGPSAGPGGLCWLRGRRVILLNQASLAIEQLGALAQALGELDTEVVSMSDEARRSISRTRYTANIAPAKMNRRPGIASHRRRGTPEPSRPTETESCETRQHVVLDSHTTLGVGGPARFFLEAKSETEISDGLDWAKTRSLPCVILGGGSNLVVHDAGFAGLVIRVALSGLAALERRQTVEVDVAAGESWDALVERSVRAGWQGIECLSGIPGLVGATPIQNVGAYGQEVGGVIKSVRTLDRVRRRVVNLRARDCRFSYRDSLFKSVEPGRFVVLAVTYRLTRGARPEVAYEELARALDKRGDGVNLETVRESVLELRRKKSMLLDPNDPNARSCGSFFLNPLVDEALAARIDRLGGTPVPRFRQSNTQIKIPAAWLIEQAGFRKGQRFGRVGLSERHALALVTQKDATARDVLSLARRIRARVLERFGVELRPEPAFWGFEKPEMHELPNLPEP